MQPLPSADASTVRVARQPILDAHGAVFGYELLYRAARDHVGSDSQGELASARVITNAILDMGLGTLTGGRKAFLNLTDALIIDGVDALLPAEGVVLEILETAAITPALIDACQRLKASGYQLALDDFVIGSASEALLPYVSFVKVDV